VVPWGKVVGIRHILVHAYYQIDCDVLWRIVTEDLPALVAQLPQAIAALEIEEKGQD
jgi:uncharacterized protein with HEPN domain